MTENHPNDAHPFNHTTTDGEGKRDFLKGTLNSMKHSAIAKAKRASWLVKETTNISPINSGIQTKLSEELQRATTVAHKESTTSQPVLLINSHETNETIATTTTTIAPASPLQPTVQQTFLSPSRSEPSKLASQHNTDYHSDHEDDGSGNLQHEKLRREKTVKSFAKKILSGSGISKIRPSSQVGNEKQQGTHVSLNSSYSTPSIGNAGHLDLKKSPISTSKQAPFPGIPLRETVYSSPSDIEVSKVDSISEGEVDHQNASSLDGTREGGVLEVRVIEAKDLYAADEGLVDAYCEIKLLGYFGSATKKEGKKTRVVKATLNPRWDETFLFDCDIGVCSGVKIVCKDNHRFREDSFLGHLTIDASGFVNSERIDRWYHLCARKRDKRNCITGQLHVMITYTSDSEAQKRGIMKVYGNIANNLNGGSTYVLNNNNSGSGGSGSGSSASGGNTSTKQKAKKKLKKYFGLCDDEILYDEFSCALRGKQGKLYVTSEHLYFFANILGVITKLKINYADIRSIEKRKTALLFPNAILIRAKQSQFFFYSFIHRDRAYELMRMKKCTYVRKQTGVQEPEEYDASSLDQEEIDIENIVSIDDGDVGVVGDNDNEFLSVNCGAVEEEEEIDPEDSPSESTQGGVSWYDIIDDNNQKEAIPSREPVISSQVSPVSSLIGCSFASSSQQTGNASSPTTPTNNIPTPAKLQKERSKGEHKTFSNEGVTSPNQSVVNNVSLYASLWFIFMLLSCLIPGLSSGNWRSHCAFLIILCTFVMLLHAPIYKQIQHIGLAFVHKLGSGGVDQHMEFVGSTVIPIMFQPVLYTFFLSVSSFLAGDFEVESILGLFFFSIAGSCVGFFFFNLPDTPPTNDASSSSSPGGL